MNKAASSEMVDADEEEYTHTHSFGASLSAGATPFDSLEYQQEVVTAPEEWDEECESSQYGSSLDEVRSGRTSLLTRAS